MNDEATRAKMAKQGWGFRLHSTGNTGVPEGFSANSLSALRDYSAYVVIAPPGHGVEAMFTHERIHAAGAAAIQMSCRNFICLHKTRAGNEWRGSHAFFLDSFEELREAVPGWGNTEYGDPRLPMDRLRRAIDRVRPERLRIMTKPAKWLGENDERHLTAVTPNGCLIVARWTPYDARAAEAEHAGIAG